MLTYTKILIGGLSVFLLLVGAPTKSHAGWCAIGEFVTNASSQRCRARGGVEYRYIYQASAAAKRNATDYDPEHQAKVAEERAERLQEAARRASADKKAAAEAAARQAKIEVERLKKLIAERKIIEAEARSKEADVRRKEVEANRVRRELIPSLTVGMRPENKFMDVAVSSGKLRDLPTGSGRIIKELPNSTQVHVVGVLPTGWVQLAEEGEPVGWMYRAALRPSSQPSSGITSARSSPDTGSSILYATNFPFPKGKPNADAIAVIIGNRVYQHPDVPVVSYAYNDVEAIRQYVIKTRGFSERNVYVLKDATKAQLEAFFGSNSYSRGRLFNAVRESKSDVFVYFSGHGVPGDKSTGYLFPSDGDPNQAELTGYSIQTLVENLAKVPARSTIIALDTCFSGISQAGALVQAASPVYLKTKIPSAGPNSIILTAAAGSQIASWDTGAQLGLFTRHLLEGMLGKADAKGGNNDGRIQLAELQSYMQSEVTYQARRRYSRDQTPEILGDPEFVLSSITGDFPGFGNPDAMGPTPGQRQQYKNPQPQPSNPEQDEGSRGFTLFGIDITPRNEPIQDHSGN